ncbi:NOL1/NOP2/sun family protein [uncultured Desulfobacterium sp.]|uniref:NOL1/NOP2/sun family protein n=1 Tax=uncultured Desulfobacterium sp. TaxID=201089 RepID=A0A445MZY0_9BACT|nr:NOL1/NOP2/sun family protein [uncultured Desulfobacterium sp.]
MDPVFEKYKEIIPDFALFQDAVCRPIPTHLRINLLKTKPELVIASLKEKGIFIDRAIEPDDTLYTAQGLKSPGGLLEYFLGYIHPQALTSCLSAIALSPKKGSYVLDMCAAPGGKTSHMAQLMGNTGLIVANELYPSRHTGLGNTLSRLGVLNTVVTTYQAQQFPLRHSFDFIMADVPCSGEGQFRKTRPNLRYIERRTKKGLPSIQKEIILRGFDLLKEDGLMLYSTCTYNPAENESVVDYLLKSRQARLLPVDIIPGAEPGLTEWRNKRYDRQLTNAARFYPHRVDSVGFFMARIARRP